MKISKTGSFVKKSLASALFTIFAASAVAEPIILENHGFETGSFDSADGLIPGWTVIGDVVQSSVTEVETNNGTTYTLTPYETQMAYLNGQGAAVSEIETELGIPIGSLFEAQAYGDSTNEDGSVPPFEGEIPEDVGGDDGCGGCEGGPQGPIPQSVAFLDVESSDSEPNGNDQLTNGSAIYQTFTAEAGDTISMTWNYVARDYIPYTDPAFAILMGPNDETIIDVLASTTGPGYTTGSDGISGVFQFTEELTQSGEYTIAFAVTNSEDDVLNPALFLDNGAGDCAPECNDDGSLENPLMPEDDDTPEVFDFTFEVTEPSIPFFIDPVVAIGYDYVVNSGPNVASVILPDIGDGVFELYAWDGAGYGNFLGEALAGVEFDFVSGGVDRFRVMGIETDAGVDPTDDMAFITGLTFVGTGTVDMSQTAISVDVVDVPEPSTLPIIGLGLLAGLFIRRKVK